MKTLSRKKKIGIIITAILTLTVIGMVRTEHVVLSGLKSEILAVNTCTQEYLSQHLGEYNTKKTQISTNL